MIEPEDLIELERLILPGEAELMLPGLLKRIRR